MNFDKIIGCIYDSLKLFDIYFNYDEIMDDLASYKINKKTAMEFYNIALEKFNSQDSMDFIDYSINAFYCGLDMNISPIICFYMENIHRIKTPEDFTELLKSEEFKKYIFQSFFRAGNSGVCLANEINNLPITSREKVSLAFVVSDYENVIRKLISQIMKAYKIIEEITEVNIDKIEEFTLSKDQMNTLSKHGFIDINNSVYGVSLINPHACKYSNFGNIFILGYSCQTQIENNYILNKITLDSVSKVFSNDIYREIINIGMILEEFTQTEIYTEINKKYNKSISTVHRCICELHDENIFIISKKTTKGVYYKMNFDYVNHARRVVENYFVFLENSNRKNRRKEKLLNL